MSLDWSAQKICDHRIVGEPLTIDEDRRTILFPRPLASQKLLITINGIRLSDDHPNWLYSLVLDETSVAPDTRKKLVFNKTQKAFDDLFEFTYFTVPNFCPKCHGLRKHRDAEWDSVGRPILYGGIAKLVLELVAGFLIFHTWIGTRIIERIGTKAVSVDRIRLAIMDEVTSFVTKYQNIQKKQIETSQEVDGEELFLRLVQVKVTPVNPNIPIVFDVVISFQNASGSIGTIESQLVLPTGSAPFSSSSRVG